MKKNLFIFIVLFLCFTSVLFYSHPGTIEKGRNLVKLGMSDQEKERKSVLLEVRETSPIVYPMDMEVISGCLVTGGAFKFLPVGSTLDKEHVPMWRRPFPAFPTTRKPGETIQVLAGAYNEELYPENLGNLNAAITLKGENGSTILDGQRFMGIGIFILLTGIELRKIRKKDRKKR